MADKKSTNEKNTLNDLPNIPKDFEYELMNLNSVVGCSNSLDGLPQFSAENIEKYENMVTAGVLSKSTVVKKYFSLGEKLSEEQYVDIGSIFTKQSDDFFCEYDFIWKHVSSKISFYSLYFVLYGLLGPSFLKRIISYHPFRSKKTRCRKIRTG